MKGKIAYTAVVEKEIEIPDEVIEISKKPWFDRTKEEDEKMENFSAQAWDSIENSNGRINVGNIYDRVGLYYQENGEDWALEEY